MDLESAYRQYAGRLFTYARGILGDHDSAADVVQDTFVLASQRSGQLRDQSRLMPWLYTITRREALRHLRRRARMFPVETLDEHLAPAHDPLTELRHAEISELVWAAYAGLVENDREIIELSVRHGLSAVDIAAVIGVSIKHANARISRARASLTVSLGVLLVARAPRDCPDLAEILGNWDGKLTVLLRKRLHRHIESCLVCGAQRKRRMDPAAILSGYAAVPFLVFTDPPKPPAPRKGGKTALIAGVILLVLLIGIPVALARPDNPRPAAVPTALTSVSPGASAVAVATQGDGGGPAPSAMPPRPPDPFTVTGEIGLRCLSSGQYALTVQAASNEPLTQAILLYQAGSGPLYFDTMTIKPSRLEATGEGMGSSDENIKWWIKASSADGETAHTSPVISDNPCS